MSNQTSVILRLLSAGLFAFGVMACEDQGPAERAGEQIDEAVEQAGEAVEEAGDKVREVTQ